MTCELSGMEVAEASRITLRIGGVRTVICGRFALALLPPPVIDAVDPSVVPPGAAVLMVTVRVPVPPPPIEPRFQVTTLPLAMPLLLAETKVVPLGMLNVSAALGAAVAPAFS